MAHLRVEGLFKSYDTRKVIDNLSLSVNAHETLVIMGASGCGKTTLLLLILGAIRPDKGIIIIKDKIVNDLPIEKREVSYVPQDFSLFPHLTVYGNISFGLRVRNYEEKEKDRIVHSLLEAIDLRGLSERKPNELSGGQKQRVALARALAVCPSLLLLDEPLSSVDEATKEDVKKNLRKTLIEMKVTTICVAHDPEDAFALGDRIAVMHGGRIVQCDTPSRLLAEPKDNMVRRLIAPMYVLSKNH